MASADFNFDLAEPLQTTTTRHQRNFSASLLSNIKYVPRTLEQREADAARNGPKYAREKAVNSILTARFRVAKQAFDAFWRYSIDDAWDGDAAAWREARDPWLRLGGPAPQRDEVMGGFVRGVVHDRLAAVEEGIERASLSAQELEAMALAVVRVARVDLEAAGRDSTGLDEGFKKKVVELVAQVATEFELPPSAPEVEEASDGEDEEASEGINGVNRD